MSENNQIAIESTQTETRIFPPPAEFAANMHTSKVLRNTNEFTPKPRKIPKRFGRARRSRFTGSRNGTRFSNGTNRLPNGLSAARSIFPTIVSTAIWKPIAKTKRRSSGKASRASNRTLTYLQLHSEVCRFANVLKKLGVETGDRVALYMPLVPELAIAMLACARIGATHTVIFGGFSADAIATASMTANVK